MEDVVTMEDTLDQLIHERCEAYRAALAVDFSGNHPATQRWRDLNRQYVRERDCVSRVVDPDRVCEACGTSIEHLKSSAKFCSDVCRVRHSRQSKTASTTLAVA
jgi:predicted nucleic acid-binding Zn ribbon protein